MDFGKLLFWRKPLIADLGGLADFIDQRAAFVVQKAIYEYSRARAGHYAKVMFSEQTFLDAVEVSRWSAYPIGLAMVAEIVEGILRAHAGDTQARQLEQLSTLVLSIYDRYAIPAAIPERAWAEARSELVQRLRMIGLHPPKRAIDVPKPFAKAYFDLMPIHPKLRETDYGTTRNYLKVVMCNVHDEVTQRVDMPAVSKLLVSYHGATRPTASA